MEIKNVKESELEKKLKQNTVEIDEPKKKTDSEEEMKIVKQVDSPESEPTENQKVSHDSSSTEIQLNLVSGIILGVFSLVMVLALSIGFRFLVSPWQMVNIPNQFVHSIVSGAILLVVASLFVPTIMLIALLLAKIPQKDKMSKKYKTMIKVTPFYKSLLTIVLVLGYVGMFIAFYFLYFTQGLNNGDIGGVFCVIGGLTSSISTLYLAYAIIVKETKPIVISSIIITASHLIFYVLYFWWWVPLIVAVILVVLFCIGGTASSNGGGGGRRVKVIHHHHYH